MKKKKIQKRQTFVSWRAVFIQKLEREIKVVRLNVIIELKLNLSKLPFNLNLLWLNMQKKQL